MQFENNVHKIMDDYNRLSKELEKFEKQFDTLGSHINHAQATFEGASSQLNVLSTKLSLIADTTEAKNLEEPEE